MKSVITILLACMLPLAAKEALPRENVIETPAIGEGLCLHNLFQSNMVIQRDKPIKIWGWADAGESIRVTLAGKTESTQADKDRNWQVTFPAMPANSEPITLAVKGADKDLKLDNILIGDIWVLGGQSNMEFPIVKVENGQLEIATAHYPQIRMLTLPRASGPEPKQSFAKMLEWSNFFKRHFRMGYWDVCSPDTVNELSAIGYVFARNLHMAAQVPIGVVDISVGGTTVEAWTPDAALRKVDAESVKTMMADWDQQVAEFDPAKDLEKRIQKHHDRVESFKKKGEEVPQRFKTMPSEPLPGPAYDSNRPGNRFAGMVAPLQGISVKGAIFHQGFNNCLDGLNTAGMYPDVFPVMITSWREAFGDAQMPFGILSMCTAGKKQTLDNYSQLMAHVSPHVREWQYRTFLDFYNQGDKNIGFASTYDLRRSWFHPQLKRPAGERIARWALATQYGFDKTLRWKPAFVEDVKVADGSVQITFDSNVAAVSDGGAIEGFAIAGEDRKFHPAKAEVIKGKTVTLTSPMVPKPVAYRYAWGQNPMGNLQTASDLPVATQRSDNWPYAEIHEEGRLKNVGWRQYPVRAKKLDEERAIKMAEAALEAARQGEEGE